MIYLTKVKKKDYPLPYPDFNIIDLYPKIISIYIYFYMIDDAPKKVNSYSISHKSNISSF